MILNNCMQLYFIRYFHFIFLHKQLINTEKLNASRVPTIEKVIFIIENIIENNN